jgi:hypothetical protein
MPAVRSISCPSYFLPEKAGPSYPKEKYFTNTLKYKVLLINFELQSTSYHQNSNSRHDHIKTPVITKLFTMNTSTTQQILPGSLAKRMLIGGGIALVLISAFLITAGKGDPSWPKSWMVRPLVITPLAGAMGGLCFHLLDRFRVQGGWRRIAANILGVLIYIVGLWLGAILGLDGTYWD